MFVSLTDQMGVTDLEWQDFLKRLRCGQVKQKHIDIPRRLVLAKKVAALGRCRFGDTAVCGPSIMERNSFVEAWEGSPPHDLWNAKPTRPDHQMTVFDWQKNTRNIYARQAWKRDG